MLPRVYCSHPTQRKLHFWCFWSLCVCVRWGEVWRFPHTQLDSNSFRQFWPSLSAGSIRSHRHELGLTLPHFRQQVQVQVDTCASNLPAIDQSFPPHPPRVQLICQSGSLENIFWFIVRGYNSRTGTWERCTGREMWGAAWSIHALDAQPFASFHVFTNLQAFWTWSFWVFMEVS